MFPRLLPSLALAAVGLAAAPSALAQRVSVYDGFFSPEGKPTGCYIRTYSAAHLKTHPRQHVTSIRLKATRDGRPHRRSGFRLDLDVRTRTDTGSVVAYCNMHGNGEARCAMEGDGGRMRLRFTGARRLRLDVRRIGIETDKGAIEVGRGISDDTVFLLDGC